MLSAPAIFRDHFGVSPRFLVQAPGRLELLGNHTDYNEGLVMSVAVDRYIQMAAGVRNDGRVHLVSSAFSAPEIFAFDRIEKNPAAPWANYVKGVLLQLKHRGVHFTGFNAAIHGTIPLGAGMSSSAALEIAAALIVRLLFPYRLTELGVAEPPKRDRHGALPPLPKGERMLLAKLCQSAEREFVGANVGLLDQISSLFGRASHVIEIDCRRLSVSHEPMPSGVALVVCDSGVKHDLAAGDYNELRRHCESAASALGVPALRSVTPEQLEQSRSKLSPRQYECAFHIVGETCRVAAGGRVLRSGDVETFGQYLFQSHASSRDYFKNSCPELDLLVEIARVQSECLGARLSGGGFGGATINLVRESAIAAFSESIAREYTVRTGRELQPAVCKIVDGASESDAGV
jgi:galactokinase